MKKIKILIILLLISLTTGCWNYRELNNLAIVSAIGIDEEDGVYNVSVQVMNPSQQSSNSKSGGSSSQTTPVDVYEGKGKSILEAINSILLKQPNDIFLGHTDLIVISDQLARKGIENFIDFLLRDRQSRKIFPMVIIKNAKASDVIKLITPIETISSKYISSTLEATKKNSGVLSDRLFDEILMCLFTRGREATISAIELVGLPEKGDESKNLSTSIPTTYFKISGSGVLVNDRLVGYFDEKESLGYTYIRNKVTASVISVPCDKEGNYAGVKLEKSKASLKTTIKDGKPVGEITLNTKAVISEFNCKVDLLKPENIKKIEDATNKELKKILNYAVVKAQKELKSDVFGFGEYIYKNKHKDWKKYEDNWNETFSNMEYKIKVTTEIRNVGAAIDSLKNSYRGNPNYGKE
ncbi:MAG: Ger(x)C family spore germination protein [Ignavibacteriales bacterium]